MFTIDDGEKFRVRDFAQREVAHGFLCFRLAELLHGVRVGFVFLVPAVQMENRTERDGYQMQPQNGFVNRHAEAHKECGHEPHGKQHHNNFCDAPEYGMVQALVAFFVLLDEVLRLGFTAGFRKGHDIVHQGDYAQGRKNTATQLGRTALTHFEHYAQHHLYTKQNIKQHLTIPVCRF